MWHTLFELNQFLNKVLLTGHLNSIQNLVIRETIQSQGL